MCPELYLVSGSEQARSLSTCEPNWGCWAQKITQAPCLKRGLHPEAPLPPTPPLWAPGPRAVPAGSSLSANVLSLVSNLIPPRSLPTFREPELLASLR